MRRFTSPAARRCLRDEDGLTLVEIMVAGLVLSIAVLGLASVASASLVSVRDARERDRSTAVASSAIEAVRAMSYDEIALRVGGDWTSDDLVEMDASGNYLLDHGDGGPDERTIWAASDGALEPYACTVATTDCWFDVPEQSRATVRVFVTWYPDASSRSSKRVTVIADAEDPSFSEPRRVQMSTVVSPASRGLPAPAFEVRPPTDATTLDAVWIEHAVATGAEECLEHTLTNFGAIDRYDLVLGTGWMTKSPQVDGTFQTENWVFRAFFVPDGEELDDIHLMTSPSATAPLRSPVALDTGESAKLHLCYQPRPDGATPPPSQPAAGDVFVFPLTFESVFDENVSHQVTHEITISDDDSFTLYLHDERGHTASHDRSWKSPRPANHKFRFEQFPMSPTHPASLVPARTTMFDYDVGVTWNNTFQALDPEGFQGLWLRASALTLHGVAHTPRDLAAEWDYQFTRQTAPVTFTGDATLRAWFRVRPSAEDSTVPPPNSRVCVDLELVKLRGNGNPVNVPTDGIIGRSRLVLDSTASWQEQVLSITVEPGGPGTGVGDVSFADKEYLRLRLWNAAPETTLESPLQCVSFHVAYGADNRPSRLIAELR